MAFIISLTMIDAYSRTTTRRFETVSTTLSAAQADGVALIAALADISDAGIVKAEYAVVDASVAAAAVAGANVDVGATLHARLENSKLYPLHVPMIMDAKLNGDGSVDLADADIVTYVAQFLTGGHLRVSEGNYVTAVEYGELDK
jgi:hypothetical protein